MIIEQLQNMDDRIVVLEMQNATVLAELADKKNDKRGDNGKYETFVS